MHEPTDVSLYRYGLDYLKAAEILLSSSGNKLPVAPFGNTISHAVELLLKSYLLSNGYDESKLKKIGHDLEKAWVKAREEGLEIDKCPEWVKVLDSAYSAPFLFRYSKNNTAVVLPNSNRLYENVVKIRMVVGSALKMDDKGNFV
ncbi:HEPN domain-containing protein [Zooshikella ganghwensis]|uniref:HEPN domain-containing protein n=1 Tax=Zooshikella ganghwensis TaxID=202772 RepID=UPI000483A626|nr:HEPN domain-containing protein [Zooshikella ganghwensis]